MADELDLATIEKLSQELDLSMVPLGAREEVREYFRKGYTEGILGASGTHNEMVIVVHNLQQFRDRGILESAMLSAFTGPKTNHSHLNDDLIATMFSCCDRQRLIAAGDPLPDGETFTIYRGVAGHGRARRLAGFSWTADVNVACWFARRFYLAHPHILTATVSRPDILAFWNCRDEREFIVRPTQFTRLQMTAEDMERHAEEHTNVMKERERLAMEMLKAKRDGLRPASAD